MLLISQGQTNRPNHITRVLFATHVETEYTAGWSFDDHGWAIDITLRSWNERELPDTFYLYIDEDHPIYVTKQEAKIDSTPGKSTLQSNGDRD